MGTRYVPEHKPSLKSGPRGASAAPANASQEIVSAPVAVEAPKVIEAHKEETKSLEKPAAEVTTIVEETIVAPAVEEKPVAVETKVTTAVDSRKKRS